MIEPQMESPIPMPLAKKALNSGFVGMPTAQSVTLTSTCCVPSWRDRMTSSRGRRLDAERAEDAIERAGPTITPEALKTFARTARKRMRTEMGGYRRDHLRAARPTRRSRSERTAHHGIEKRTPAHARSRVKRKNGGVWRAQFRMPFLGEG